MDEADRAAHLTIIGRMATLVAAINELIDQSPDPAAVRSAIAARVDSVARIIEVDDNPDHAFMAMQMRAQMEEFSE